MHRIFSEIQSYQLCDGVKDSVRKTSVNVHSIPCEINLEDQIQSSYRSSDCRMLLNGSSNKCDSCKKFEKPNERQIIMKEKIANTPAKLNVSLSKTNPSHVNLALKEQGRKCTEVEKKISKMQEQINLLRVEVNPVLKDHIHELIEHNLEVVSPFMELFWKEQKKYLSIKPKAKKYHPMIIRFFLSLAAKSLSVYDELRDWNILILPSRGTFRNYKNAIRPHAEFKESAIDELTKIVSSLKGYQRCAVYLLMR